MDIWVLYITDSSVINRIGAKTEPCDTSNSSASRKWHYYIYRKFSFFPNSTWVTVKLLLKLQVLKWLLKFKIFNLFREKEKFVGIMNILFSTELLKIIHVDMNEVIPEMVDKG